jgi:hypothetical protein
VDGDHQVGAGLHVGSFAFGGLNGVPDAVKISDLRDGGANFHFGHITHTVIPAKAGIQLYHAYLFQRKLDPCFRRGDGLN